MVAPRQDERQPVSPGQHSRLAELFAEILPRNRFYARKLAGHDPADFTALPFTTKDELLADQAAHPLYGQGLTYPLEQYCRLHQTSGSAGRPLRWLDTAQSWDWMLSCWDAMLDLARVGPGERLLFPFSFGPFLGFWTAFEAVTRRGLFCLPAGGMSSSARLRLLLDVGATVVLCTPTYALRLAEVAREEGVDLAGSAVRALIVAGEPGGSIPTTRNRIEQSWGARVFDHCGMTEIGPAGIECAAAPGGLHLLESHYVVEVIDPDSLQPLPPGTAGELVLTNLGRWGSPLVRYRTGDLVRLDTRPCACGSPFVRLEGGLLGRRDDMIHLRGNNIYPSALEEVVRGIPDVAEFRIAVDRTATLPVLRVEVEPVPGGAPDLAARVDRAIYDAFFFRAEVHAVPPGTLPRFEMKSRRFTRQHSQPGQ